MQVGPVNDHCAWSWRFFMLSQQATIKFCVCVCGLVDCVLYVCSVPVSCVMGMPVLVLAVQCLQMQPHGCGVTVWDDAVINK